MLERRLARAFAGRGPKQRVAENEIDAYFQPIERSDTQADLLAATNNPPSLGVAFG